MSALNTVCKVCMRKVLDTNQGLQCVGNCQRWYHRECMRVTKAQCSQLLKDQNKKWMCNRVDCVPDDQDLVSALTSQVSKLVTQVSNLSDKLDKFDDIKTISEGVASIRSDLRTIADRLENMEPRIATTESRIKDLTKEIDNLKCSRQPSVDVSMECILEEIFDRNRRTRNVIVYGVPESASANVDVKKECDKSNVSTILRSINLDVQAQPRLFRLGKTASNKLRPLKLIFGCEADALRMLRNFSSSLLTRIDGALSNVTISRDRTPKERKHLGDLRALLEERKKGGEVNLTIKYVNSVPKIVDSPKN